MVTVISLPPNGVQADEPSRPNHDSIAEKHQTDLGLDVINMQTTTVDDGDKFRLTAKLELINGSYATNSETRELPGKSLVNQTGHIMGVEQHDTQAGEETAHLLSTDATDRDPQLNSQIKRRDRAGNDKPRRPNLRRGHKRSGERVPDNKIINRGHRAKTQAWTERLRFTLKTYRTQAKTSINATL